MKITKDSFTSDQLADLEAAINVEEKDVIEKYYHRDFKKWIKFCDTTHSWEGSYNYAVDHGLIDWRVK